MRRSLLLLLTLATALVVTACTGDPGPPGPRGEQGPAGADGQPATSDVDAIVQRLADDPAFRQALVDALARDHAEDLRGPAGADGAEGVCDCGDVTPATSTCVKACSSDEECGAFQACVEQACAWVGCSDDAQCQGVHGQGYVCVMP